MGSGFLRNQKTAVQYEDEMQKLVLFKVSDRLFAIDQKFVKKKYQKEELFRERANQAKKVRVKIDGQDIPLYNLSTLFSSCWNATQLHDTEAMLVKDEEGYMVLLADTIEGACETKEEDMKELSPIFGKRSRACFPRVLVKNDSAVLVLSPSGIRADAVIDTGQQPEIH